MFCGVVPREGYGVLVGEGVEAAGEAVEGGGGGGEPEVSGGVEGREGGGYAVEGGAVGGNGEVCDAFLD